MARLPRSALPEGYYHVTTRGVDKCWIYHDDADRLLFLRLVYSATQRYDWDFYALCLMGNHYHFVVDAVKELLSLGMHRVNGIYALAFNRKYGRTGHLFGDRFGVRVVDDYEQLADVCRYVVNNPVRAGLCQRASDWPWNGCRYGLDI
jgi:REP element-mobilizing transposase RayT